MTTDWQDYLELAEELHNQASDKSSSLQDARLRSAISRAYYAAYHNARQLLVQYNIFIRKEDAHSFVINELETLDPRRTAFLAQKLRRLRNDRNNADYQRNADITPSLAEKSIREAKYICNQMAAIKKNTNS